MRCRSAHRGVTRARSGDGPRPWHCGAPTAARTPCLDALAERSLIFERAFCIQPVCTPSRGSTSRASPPTPTAPWPTTCRCRRTWRSFPRGCLPPRSARRPGCGSRWSGKGRPPAARRSRPGAGGRRSAGRSGRPRTGSRGPSRPCPCPCAWPWPPASAPVARDPPTRVGHRRGHGAPGPTGPPSAVGLLYIEPRRRTPWHTPPPYGQARTISRCRARPCRNYPHLVYCWWRRAPPRCPGPAGSVGRRVRAQSPPDARPRRAGEPLSGAYVAGLRPAGRGAATGAPSPQPVSSPRRH